MPGEAWSAGRARLCVVQVAAGALEARESLRMLWVVAMSGHSDLQA